MLSKARRFLFARKSFGFRLTKPLDDNTIPKLNRRSMGLYHRCTLLRFTETKKEIWVLCYQDIAIKIFIFGLCFTSRV